MAVVGLGTDIVAVARLQQTLERQPGLAQRLLLPVEREAMARANNEARFLAKRFAAKEAALKALGTGLGNGLSWQDLQIKHTDLGQPLLALTGAAASRAAALGATRWHLSISDEQDYAVATVVLEQ